jgi:hypothetical protein
MLGHKGRAWPAYADLYCTFVDEIARNYTSRFALKHSNVMPTRTNISQSRQDSSAPSGQLPLDFSTPALRSASSHLKSSSTVREVPRAVAPARFSPAVKPAPMSAVACGSSMAWDFPSSARAAVRSMTALISMLGCSRISAEGRPERRLYGP